MKEQYQCKSYYEDGKIVDCECGKCEGGDGGIHARFGEIGTITASGNDGRTQVQTWKEEFSKVFEINDGAGRINGYIVKNVGDAYSRPATVEDIEMYIESLLEQQRKEAYFEGCRDGMSNKQIITLSNEIKKDLINQILSEAPEDRNYGSKIKDYDLGDVDGFNQANLLWRELISKLK